MAADNNLFRLAPTLTRCFICVMICVGGWMQETGAADFTYSLGYRAEYSDNIYRIPDEREGQSDLINSILAGFTYLENTSTFNARILGSITYEDYYNKTFENRTNNWLDAYAEFFFVPQVVSWVAADGFRKVQVDPLQPDTPTNRQDSNVFVTGPNVYLRFGPVDTLTIEARYGRSWVEDVDIDSERDFFATRWAHRLSARSTLSLNYEFLDVDYENSTLNTDFLRHNFFIRANVHSARNIYTLDLGRTRIEPDGDEPISNWLVRLDSTWQASSISSVGIHYGREYSDTASDLIPTGVIEQIASGGIIPPLGTDVVTGELYYTERVELIYARRGNTFPWSARLFNRRIDYETSPDDRQEKGSLIDVRYVYSNTLTFQVSSSYTVLEYEQPVRDDRDAIMAVALIYRAGPNLTAGLDLRRYVRKSTDSSQEYTDDRLAITINYATRPAAH
jgi:hypothetical protein